MKGKSLVWLHKLDGDECEVSLFHQSFPENRCSEELGAHLESNYYGAWDSELKRMKPGDWVRFTIKWELVYTRSYCHYYGAYEHDSEAYVTRVRTLARGHYAERYLARGAA